MLYPLKNNSNKIVAISIGNNGINLLNGKESVLNVLEKRYILKPNEEKKIYTDSAGKLLTFSKNLSDYTEVFSNTSDKGLISFALFIDGYDRNDFAGHLKPMFKNISSVKPNNFQEKINVFLYKPMPRNWLCKKKIIDCRPLPPPINGKLDIDKTLFIKKENFK